MTDQRLIQLDRFDLHQVQRRLPVAVRNLMRSEGSRAVLAGGFIRAVVAREDAHDVDLFTPTPDLAELFARQICDAVGGRLVTTANALTVVGAGLPVQFIRRWTYAEPAALLDSFDFTVACAAAWCVGESGWDSLADERFYVDLAARRLVYRAPSRNEDAGGSMLRLLKFYQRGYRAPLDTVGHVAARIAMGIADDRLADAIGRRDERLLGKLISGKLREVDPSADPTHEAHVASPNDEEAGS